MESKAYFLICFLKHLPCDSRNKLNWRHSQNLMAKKTLLVSRHLFGRMKSTKMLGEVRVEVGDKDEVERKLRTLSEGGPSKLQLIVDFDYTMSRAHRNNEPVDCSWGVLENFPELPKGYTEKVKELRSKYYPIEIDPTLSVAEKTPHMAEVFLHIVFLISQFSCCSGTLKPTWPLVRAL